MNSPQAFAQWTERGYIGIYSPVWTTGQEKVTDARGNVQTFNDQYKAEAFAWRALRAFEEQRYRALQADPGQIPPPKQPRSKAGRRANANAVFKIKEQS